VSGEEAISKLAEREESGEITSACSGVSILARLPDEIPMTYPDASENGRSALGGSI
jgi:hypothetical protein